MVSEDGTTSSSEGAVVHGEVPVVSEKTARFLSMLHGYLDTRKQMDVKYQEEDPEELLANFDVGDERAEPAYTKELQQQFITGEPVNDIDELYEAAKLAKPVYERIVQKLVDQVHAATAEEADDDEDDDEVVFAPLKAADRALEKAKDDYANRVPGPGVSWLFDIVRGSIKFTSTAELRKCMELLMNPPEGEGEAEFRLVKAKNRFENPTLSGYRDFNVCIQITVPNNNGSSGDRGSFEHICELQIHHIAIKSLSKLLHSHHYYEFFRSYFNGETSHLTNRMEDLEYIARGETLDGKYLAHMLATSTDELVLSKLNVFFCDFLCEYELAMKACERFLEIRQSRTYKELEEPGLAYFYMGRVCQKQGNVDKALECYAKYVEIRLQVLGPDDLGIADANVLMGVIYDQKLGKPEEAFVLYQKAEKSIVKARGPETLWLLDVYPHMAKIYQQREDYEKAVQMCEKAQMIMDRYHSLEHTTNPVGETFAIIAEIRHKQGKYEDAVELYNKAAKMLVIKLGPDHPSVQKVEQQLADAKAGIALAEDETR